jgi:hypothetical protein
MTKLSKEWNIEIGFAKVSDGDARVNYSRVDHV